MEIMITERKKCLSEYYQSWKKFNPTFSLFIYLFVQYILLPYAYYIYSSNLCSTEEKFLMLIFLCALQNNISNFSYFVWCLKICTYQRSFPISKIFSASQPCKVSKNITLFDDWVKWTHLMYTKKFYDD